MKKVIKTIEQLKHGKCEVVAISGDNIRHFKGEYVEALNVVFFAIPDHFQIIGYIQ